MIRLLVLLGLCLGLACNAASAARWFDSLPADDPDMVVRRAGPATQPTAPDAPASLPASFVYGTGSAAGAVYGATTGLLYSIVGGIASVGSGASEAVWETAYMFGINRTKMPRPEVVDPIPELRVTADEDTPRARALSPALLQTPAPAPTEAAPTQPISVAAAAATPAAPANALVTTNEPQPKARDVDPGLLANFVFDRGSRQPDGSFLVPKPLQRLFEVRTARLTTAEVPVTLTLPGRIVPDRHTQADVEASLLGRIEVPPSGRLPVLGDIVTKGQVLAYVVPAVGVVDRTQVRREVARLTTDIRVEAENQEILKQFSFVPFRDGKLYQSEQRLAGLRRERAALLPLLQTQEVLRAETDGVISVSTAILGRIVHPGEKVFEVVNPKELWVEALAPDPAIAESAQRVATASALTPDGTVLTLTYVGSGLALQQQSTPILFRIENPPEGLRVGRPVAVAVQSENRSQRGLPVPRDALAIGPDGVREVWEQTQPEVFLPHPVSTVDLDERRVLIVDGLKEGSHIVVQGVRLLAQLQ